MITFFRRALSSWAVLGLLGIILIAFLFSGVLGPGMSGPSVGGSGTAAKVGSAKVSVVELARRSREQFDGAKREQPALDIKTFLSAGGFERVTDVLINMRAVESWGRDQGFAIGKRLVDAEIAGIPAFRGVTGQFDEAAMRNALAQNRINEKDFREGMAADLLRGQVLASVQAPVSAPLAFAKPYATLLLEQRTGSVGIIPLAAVADMTPPTDAAVNAAYKANIAAYTRPELRALRYAVLGIEQVADASKPSEAEIADYYRGHADDYAAKESRDLTQVIAPTEAAARSLATTARSGGSLQAAASKSGLEASALTKQVRADYAKSSTDAVATAAFTAAKGAVIDPIKGAFGWYVVRVDAVSGVAARSIDQVRPDITAILTKQKQQDALSDISDKIDAAIADGASFEEVVRSNKLTLVETPPILQSGQNPEDPAWKAPPEVAPLLKSAFAMLPDDKPVVETLIPEQRYALLGLAKVVPPTPVPLATVRPAVVRDIILKRTNDKAKATANAVAAAVNRGVPIAKALADTGLKLPPIQPAKALQIEITRARPDQVPSPLRALFTLRKGKAVAVPANQGGVWYVTVLEQIIPGDLAKAPGLVDQVRGDLARTLPNDLAEQFQRAVQASVDIKRYPDAIAEAKRQMAGQ